MCVCGKSPSSSLLYMGKNGPSHETQYFQLPPLLLCQVYFKKKTKQNELH